MGNKGKSKARKRNVVKDLKPKDTKQMKGGGATQSDRVTHHDLVITKSLDKS